MGKNDAASHKAAVGSENVEIRAIGAYMHDVIRSRFYPALWPGCLVEIADKCIQ